MAIYARVKHMRLLQSIFQKEEKKHNLGVCIPDSSRVKRQEKAEEIEAVGKSFVVSGLFHVQDSLMVKGTAFGTIKTRDKAKFHGTKLVVREVQVEGKDAEAIMDGEEGALFLKAEKGKFPVIKNGDILEF